MTCALLFPCDPMNPREVEPAYARERDAVGALGLTTGLVDHEALVDEHDPRRAVRRVPESQTAVTGVYRGWMVRPTTYSELFQALHARGVKLINSPQQYRHAHYLPEWYSLLEGITPKSVWYPLSGTPNWDAIQALLTTFTNRPLVLKDYVKSQKHYWKEACFIPSAADRGAVQRVVRRFLELQGDDFNEGLVFREFVELADIGRHPKSGMPLTKEFRVFVLAGEPILTIPYWDEVEYHDAKLPIDQFSSAMMKVQSNFYTMDVAELKGGGWTIMELGDGQVAGLPERADASAFYSALRDRIRTATLGE